MTLLRLLYRRTETAHQHHLWLLQTLKSWQLSWRNITGEIATRDKDMTRRSQLQGMWKTLHNRLLWGLMDAYSTRKPGRMVDSSCVLPLPTSLVLLLHLHILSYPQCNSPEYFPATVFSLTRPLRDRTKTMEVIWPHLYQRRSHVAPQDIVAFLIEKIEGKAKCKSVGAHLSIVLLYSKPEFFFNEQDTGRDVSMFSAFWYGGISGQCYKVYGSTACCSNPTRSSSINFEKAHPRQ